MQYDQLVAQTPGAHALHPVLPWLFTAVPVQLLDAARSGLELYSTAPADRGACIVTLSGMGAHKPPQRPALNIPLAALEHAAKAQHQEPNHLVTQGGIAAERRCVVRRRAARSRPLDCTHALFTTQQPSGIRGLHSRSVDLRLSLPQAQSLPEEL
jgi:hypothetical protein